MIGKIQVFCERQTFGVCTWLGEKLGMDSGRIRKTFIYTSFITFGSPLVVYLAMAFILENKDYFMPKSKRPTIWEL